MTRFIFSNILSFALIVVALQASAQGTVEGIVLEETEQQAVEFSTVTLFKAADSTLIAGTTSNAYGKFVITNIPNGNYYAVIQFVGFKIQKVSGIQITGYSNVNVGKVVLVPSQKLLNEVVITEQRATVLQQADKQVFAASFFQTSQGGNATELLRNLPSISMNAEGDITLRGSSSFTVLLDGKPVQGDPSVILGQLPANAIENVEIMTTPSAKFDPDGKSGIINIVTKKGSVDGHYIALNLQPGLPSLRDYENEDKPVRFGGDLTANFRKGKWNVSLSTNYKRDDIAGYRVGEADTYLNGIKTSSPSKGERSYYSYSYGARLTATYEINNQNNIEAGFYAGKRSQFRKADIVYDQKRFVETTGELLNSLPYFNKNLRERKGDFIVSNIDYTHTFKHKGAITFSALYEKTILGGPTRNKNVNPENNSEVFNDANMQEDNPLDGVRFKADYTLPVGKKGKLETGYQYRYLLHKGNFIYSELNTSTGNWFIREEFSNQIRLTRHIHSLYSQFSNEIGRLNYSAGLRLEEVDRVLKDADVAKPYRFERLNLFPTANLQYSLPQEFKIKAGYSRRISHTTSNMMNPFPARRHSEVFEIGDPELLPEYIDVVEVGASKDFGNNSAFITFYYRNTENVINRVNNVYNDTILNRTFTNAGRAEAWGIEGGMDLKITSWWNLFVGGNLYWYSIHGNVYNENVNTSSVNYLVNSNTTFKILPTLMLQLTLNYTSRTVTAQGIDSRFLVPGAILKKTISKGQGSISIQWQNIDLGILETNEQHITTRGENYYSTTNYIQEVDIIRINFSYQLNKLTRKLRFTESEFGEKEF